MILCGGKDVDLAQVERAAIVGKPHNNELVHGVCDDPLGDATATPAWGAQQVVQVDISLLTTRGFCTLPAQLLRLTGVGPRCPQRQPTLFGGTPDDFVFAKSPAISRLSTLARRTAGSFPVDADAIQQIPDLGGPTMSVTTTEAVRGSRYRIAGDQFDIPLLESFA
jgi:hypothetical protein